MASAIENVNNVEEDTDLKTSGFENDRFSAKELLNKSSESLELDFEEDVNIKETEPQNLEEHPSDKANDEEDEQQEELEEGEDGELSDDEPAKVSEKEAKENELEKDEDEGEISENDSENKDEGEISDDDDGLEDGELKEAAQPSDKPSSRQICRFFNRGRCTFGQVCRFLHLSYNSRGNYSMFSNPTGPFPPPPPPFMRENPRFMLNQDVYYPPPPPPPPPPPVHEQPMETPWEHELYATKELMEKHKYTRRGPSFSPEFDEKAPENDKENKNFSRRRERFDDEQYGYGDSNWKRNYNNNYETGPNNASAPYRDSDRSRSFRRNNGGNDRERDKSKTFREKKRSRSRSGSYSYSDRSSRSSYSRSSSLSSWESSRTPSPHKTDRKSPIESPLIPKYNNPVFDKEKSDQRSKRYRRYSRSRSHSRNRPRSRSISMDSISDESGSSSNSESDTETGIPPPPPTTVIPDEAKANILPQATKRPHSPSPEPTLIPKKGIHSRRDDLLKQLKAVEDAIARKRGKFS